MFPQPMQPMSQPSRPIVFNPNQPMTRQQERMIVEQILPRLMASQTLNPVVKRQFSQGSLMYERTTPKLAAIKTEL